MAESLRTSRMKPVGLAYLSASILAVVSCLPSVLAQAVLPNRVLELDNSNAHTPELRMTGVSEVRALCDTLLCRCQEPLTAGAADCGAGSTRYISPGPSRSYQVNFKMIEVITHTATEIHNSRQC